MIADHAASAVETAEKQVRTEKNLIPAWVVLIESWDDIVPFKTFCEKIAGDGTFAEAIGRPEVGIYRLQNSRCTLPWSVG